jgi:hypothetical protein
MAESNHTVIFSREGVTVQEERETPLSEDTKTVTIDELDWDSFPMDLLMKVTSVEPVPNEDDETSLSELRFTVSRLERSSSETSRETVDDFWEHVEEETGITKQDGQVSLSGDKNAKNNLVSFVHFLIKNGYLTEDDLPVESGWKRYLINTEPVNQRGEKMTQEEEVVDGIFLETKFSRKDIQKHINELAEWFGE